MSILKKIRKIYESHEVVFSLAILLIIVVLAYVPSMKGSGFYSDDYHIVYGGYTSGVSKLLEIAQIDRPFHGYTFAIYFPIFKFNIHAYQLFEITLNYLTALLGFFLIRSIWPRQKALGFYVAVFMSIYPGYIDHMHSFNFCLFMLNLLLYVLSLFLSARSQIVKSKMLSVIFTIVGILSFLWAVLLNEYYLGLEVFRLGILFVYEARYSEPKKNFWRNLKAALIRYLPFLISGIGFFFWRFFIFTNQRGATNLGSFTGMFTSSPIYESISILRGLFSNFLNVVLFAWAEPLYRYINTLRLKDFLLCGGLALLGTLIVIIVAKEDRQLSSDTPDEENDLRQIIVISTLTVFVVLLPIVFVNREATLEFYGRYALPAMIASCLLVSVLLFRFVKPLLRNGLICLMIFSGIFTQLSVGRQLAYDWQGSKELWWQLSWRAPLLNEGTVLAGYSSNYAISEGFNLWAPANLIYYPEETNPVVTGETLNTEFIKMVIEDKDLSRDFRSFKLESNTDNLLVLSKPSNSSCLHLIDGSALDFSASDPAEILLIGEYSHLDQVLTDAESHSPPEQIFGSEPEHTWCYYYEKAALAFQKGNMDEVINLKEEADSLGYKASDASELLPFILAYAQQGGQEKLKELLPIYLDSHYLMTNLCQNLSGQKYAIDPSAAQALYQEACH